MIRIQPETKIKHLWCWDSHTSVGPNREIAHRLGLAEKTVRNNVSAVMTKLRVTDRAAAAAAALDAGFGQAH